ncbi:hypothetical protein LTR04_004002 [Oleoguttula sp. CCFEE 6159]|nr:hypothetical protein LTR04_004002 [Oleoguttula sp. CCFEE 6159]
MVKPDVKRNYYADLELPPDACVDDVKKQFRKLALKYHPDRNPGRETDVIPRFQAIQAAHEILHDPETKSKYDGDRRKAGLYPTPASYYARPTPPTRSSYVPTFPTDFPPPPRRAQQPQSNAGRSAAGEAEPATPNGANRHASFPKAPGAEWPFGRKGSAQQEQANNVYNAWKNVHPSGAKESSSFESQSSRTTPQRPRNTRAGTHFPTEEEIRKGTNYRSRPQAPNAAEDDSAYSRFHNSPQPGVGRSNTTRTPKRPGFDPATPGADERQASGTANYFTSSRYDRPQPERTQTDFPPPPPRAPTAKKPDPLGQFRARHNEDDVPFAEPNRLRTPYSSHLGEKTDPYFSAEGVRRTASTRDTTRSNRTASFKDSNTGRHHSASPVSQRAHAQSESSPRAQAQSFGDMGSNGSQQNQKKSPPFVEYGESESESGTTSDGTSDAEDMPSHMFGQTASGKRKAPIPPDPLQRPKATPSPPSRRQNSGSPLKETTSGDGTFGREKTQTGAQNGLANGMGQKSKSTMYDDHLNFLANKKWSDWWPFGSTKPPPSVSQQQQNKVASVKVPNWAYPSSVSPPKQMHGGAKADQPDGPTTNTKRPTSAKRSHSVSFDFPPWSFAARSDGGASVSYFVNVPYVPCHDSQRLRSHQIQSTAPQYTADTIYPNSFTIPTTDSAFDRSAPSDTPDFEGRSTENINTKFSPGDWTGKFTGSTEYFANPPPPLARKDSRAQTSPTRWGRPKSHTLQHATSVSGTAHNASNLNGTPASSMPPPPPPPPRPLRAHASEGSTTMPAPPNEVKFLAEEWARTLKEPTWVFPPPTPTASKTKQPTRKQSRSTVKPGVVPKPASVSTVVDEDDEGINHTAEGLAEQEESDAMDIDPDPIHPRPPPRASEPVRLVSVPPSPWRNGQPTPDSNLTANLADLAGIAPLAPATGAGLKDLADVASTLPFASRASSMHPTHGTFAPQNLELPLPPKAPQPPTKLTKSSWASYLHSTGAYMRAWVTYNGKMVAHFTARQQIVEDLMVREGEGWLNAKGELSSSVSWIGGAEVDGAIKGFQSYEKAIKEDERVREHWNVSCEKHAKAVETFGRSRMSVLASGAAGGLPDI